MELFEMVNGYVSPSIHVLLIEPFKTIWDNDTSKNNIDSIKLFTYVELMCNPRKSNPFFGCSEDERPAKVKQEVWGNPDHPVDTDMVLAVIKYKELLSKSSPSYDLYVSGVNAVHKLRKFLDDFNMNERTPSGAMVMKPKDITNALKDLDDVGKNMELSRDRVHSEMITNTKTRNEREIGDFER